MVMLSRSLVVLLCLGVYALYHLNARFAYALPRGGKKLFLQLSTVLGSAVIFMMQLKVMEHLAPADAYGNHFFAFVLIEAGGATVILFTTALRERQRMVTGKKNKILGRSE